MIKYIQVISLVEWEDKEWDFSQYNNNQLAVVSAVYLLRMVFNQILVAICVFLELMGAIVVASVLNVLIVVEIVLADSSNSLESVLKL